MKALNFCSNSFRALRETIQQTGNSYASRPELLKGFETENKVQLIICSYCANFFLVLRKPANAVISLN
jgi:hypothetical protein